MFSRKQQVIKSKPQAKFQALQLGNGGTLLSYVTTTDPSPLPSDSGVSQTVSVTCQPTSSSIVFLQELIITIPVGPGAENLCDSTNASAAKIIFDGSTTSTDWSCVPELSADGTQLILDIIPSAKGGYTLMNGQVLKGQIVNTLSSGAVASNTLVNMTFQETAAFADPSDPTKPSTFVTRNWATGLSKASDGYNLYGFQISQFLSDMNTYESVLVVDANTRVFVQWITDPTMDGLDLSLSYGETTVSVNDSHTGTSYQYPAGGQAGILLGSDTIFQLTASYIDSMNGKQTISYQWLVRVAQPWILADWNTTPSLTEGTTAMSVMKWDPITINWNVNNYVQFCEIVITDDASTTTISKDQLGSGPSFSYTIPNLSKDSQITVWAYGYPSANQQILADYQQFTAKVFDYFPQNQPITVGTWPVAVAVSPSDNSVWVTSRDNNNISVISAISKKVVNTIGVGTRPWGIAINPHDNSVWVANSGSNTVSVIPAISGSPMAVGSSPLQIAISPDGSSVWTTNFVSNDVSMISVSSGKVVSIGVDAGPVGIAINPLDGSVWVPTLSKSISVISANGQKVSTIEGVVSAGTALRQNIAFSPDGNTAWVLNSDNNTVSMISVSTQKVSTIGGLGDDPTSIAMSYDGSIVLVTNSGSNTVSVISVSGGKVVSTIGVGSVPTGIAISPDGNNVWVINFQDNNVSLIQKQPIGSAGNALVAPALRATAQVGNALALAVPAPRTSTQLRGLRLGLETLLQTMAATVPSEAQKTQCLEALKARLQSSESSRALVPASNRSAATMSPILTNLPAYNPAAVSSYSGDWQGREQLVALKAFYLAKNTAASSSSSALLFSDVSTRASQQQSLKSVEMTAAPLPRRGFK